MIKKPSGEDVIWRLHKGLRTVEARIASPAERMRQPELRIYTNNAPKAAFSVSWFQAVSDERACKAMSEAKKAEWLASGWVEAVKPTDPA